MDLGHLAVGATGGDDFVGDFGTGGIGRVARLGSIWSFVGPGVDDESGPWCAPAVFARVGAVSRARRKRSAVEACGARGRHCYFVLRAVDDSQLCCFSQIYS